MQSRWKTMSQSVNQTQSADVERAMRFRPIARRKSSGGGSACQFQVTPGTAMPPKKSSIARVRVSSGAWKTVMRTRAFAGGKFTSEESW